MEIKCTEYLTWQSAGPAKIPQPVGDVLPTWWRQLPGDMSSVQEQNQDHRQILTDHGNRSARFCLGLRGAHNLGWTIPLERKLGLLQPQQSRPALPTNPTMSWKTFYHGVRDSSWPDCDSESQFWDLPQHIQQELVNVHGYRPPSDQTMLRPFMKLQNLHPAMLEGSVWSQRVNGDYQWGIKLVTFPWRAVLPLGWRLLIMAHPLEWSHDWHVFSGCVDAGYYNQRPSTGSFWQWPYAMQEDRCYFNIEVVLAYRLPHVVIPMNTCLFSAVPVWDPDYQPRPFRGHPSFVG